jgi:hypothetical protein
VPQAAFSGLPVTLSLVGASTDHPFSLGIPQTRVEEVLEAHALDLAKPHTHLAEPRGDAHAEATAIRQAAEAWADRVGPVRATCPAHPDLRAVLVRPDGRTAWLSTAGRTHQDAGHPADGLRQALTHWHGPPRE